MSRGLLKRPRSIKNKLIIGLFIIFFLGMWYGSVTVAIAPKEIVTKLSQITVGFADKRVEQSVFSTFIHSFGADAFVLIILYLLGFSAIAQPLELFVPAFYGLGVGASMGYIYSAYSFQGIVYCFVMIVPTTVISTFAVVLATREACFMSNLFLGNIIPRFKADISIQTLKLYSIKYLVLLGFALASAVVDCVFTFLFAGLFSM